MKNELLTKGIILPSGEIGKNKINLVAGAITQPFAEMVWVTTGGDMETINRLTNVLVTMNNPTDRGKLFKIIKLLYTVKLIYERGEQMIPAGQYFNGSPDPQFGKFERFEAIPNDPDALKWLLREEHRNREQLPPGDFKAHIAALHDGLIETEARRIVREMKRHDTPNSPNKTHFMVELSPAFMQLANTKDIDRLFSMLPYKTLSFSKIEGRHGTYALIDKGENRDKEIKKPRPSVRAQLAADKKTAAPKKSAAKRKNHDLEV